MGDNQLRLDFADKLLICYDEDISWPLRILSTDKAHYMLIVNLNSKYCVQCADNNPHDAFTSSLHDKKVTTWCGITRTFILGTYFFEEVTDGDLQTCTITTVRYLRHVNSLCHSGIATAKCSIWSCVDAKCRSSTYRVWSQTSLKSTVFGWQLSPVISRFRGHQGLQNGGYLQNRPPPYTHTHYRKQTKAKMAL